MVLPLNGFSLLALFSLLNRMASSSGYTGPSGRGGPAPAVLAPGSRCDVCNVYVQTSARVLLPFLGAEMNLNPAGAAVGEGGVWPRVGFCR